MKRTTYRGAGPARGGKTALRRCGGGITGALFEVGVLSALDDFEGRPAANQFDIYVGSSAGASVASFRSQRVTADRAFQALRAATADRRAVSRGLRTAARGGSPHRGRCHRRCRQRAT